MKKAIVEQSDPKKQIQIADLLDVPEALPVVGGWIHEEWGGFSGRTLEQTFSRFREGIIRGRLPITLLALRGREPLGLATLREKDSVDWYPGVMPWICNVYVKKEARGQGLASKLCRALEPLAGDLGFSILYLATELEDSLYKRIGYEIFHQLQRGGETFYVMRRNLPTSPQAEKK